VVVAVERPEGRAVRGYGRLDPAADAPTSTTRFEIASITKLFTALALAQLVLSETVSLDTSLAELLPDDVLRRARDSRLRLVTLGHLALHTSGLPKNSDGLVTSALRSPLSPFSHLDLDDLHHTLVRRPLAFAPGSGWRYSNLGYGLLGQVLCERAGRPFGELVQALVCGPLGSRGTAEPVPGDGAATARVLGISFPPWSNGVCAAAGDLRSTADDLLVLGRLAHGGGPTSLRAAAEITLATRLPRGDREWQGLGWQGWRIGGDDWIGHGGSAAGSRASLTVHPRMRTVLVALACGRPWTIGRSLDRLVPRLWHDLLD
jgi:CubicO group peptidase (beta-lactamase class C family)